MDSGERPVQVGFDLRPQARWQPRMAEQATDDQDQHSFSWSHASS